jgi:hypothetical protein
VIFRFLIIMKLSHFAVNLSLAVVVFAVDPIVDLSYSKYEGTALANGVSQWLGIRYAVSFSHSRS